MVTPRTVWQALAEVMDPELPVSIVDMGLIYDVRVQETRVEVDMTFTAIACPAMEMLTADVSDKINMLSGVANSRVNVVWNPPWTKSKMTPQGREILESFGIAV